MIRLAAEAVLNDLKFVLDQSQQDPSPAPTPQPDPDAFTIRLTGETAIIAREYFKRTASDDTSIDNAVFYWLENPIRRQKMACLFNLYSEKDERSDDNAPSVKNCERCKVNDDCPDRVTPVTQPASKPGKVTP